MRERNVIVLSLIGIAGAVITVFLAAGIATRSIWVPAVSRAFSRPEVEVVADPSPEPYVHNRTVTAEDSTAEEPREEDIPVVDVLLSGDEGPAAFSISGVPESVDPANVLRALGEDEFGNEFVNTVGLGSEMMLAEPGVLLVGPDFDPGLVEVSDGHIEWISPITQFTLNNPGSTDANAAEGAFLWFTGARVHASVRGIEVSLEAKEGHNWFLLVRGLFADSKQDSDRNSTVTFTQYVPGHAQVMLYPPGAYVSEGNFLQVTELSHTSGRNCGKEGCSELTVLFLDLNTGAYAVIYQPQLGADWQEVAGNWR